MRGIFRYWSNMYDTVARSLCRAACMPICEPVGGFTTTTYAMNMISSSSLSFEPHDTASPSRLLLKVAGIHNLRRQLRSISGPEGEYNCQTLHGTTLWAHTSLCTAHVSVPCSTFPWLQLSSHLCQQFGHQQPMERILSPLDTPSGRLLCCCMWLPVGRSAVIAATCLA